MKYEIGDKIKNYNEYLNDCLDFEYLHNNLKVGNHVIMQNDTKIIKTKFIGFRNCAHKMETIRDGKIVAGCCISCKGKLKFENSGLLHCSGYTNASYTNIYKILEDNNLPEDLFEI